MIIDVGLLLFQARGQEIGDRFAASVTTHTHGSAGNVVRYYCRYELAGQPLAYEAPAGRSIAEALTALREALAQHLGASTGT